MKHTIQIHASADGHFAVSGAADIRDSAEPVKDAAVLSCLRRSA
jgi:hypothetical protein